jgi:hydrogenase/urease accessory protein HupE
MRSTSTMQGTRASGRLARAATLGLTAASMSVHAHGDHGPGGHDGWTLDHAHFEHWGIAEWGLVALLVIVAVGVWSRRRSRGTQRQKLRAREASRR